LTKEIETPSTLDNTPVVSVSPKVGLATHLPCTAWLRAQAFQEYYTIPITSSLNLFYLLLKIKSIKNAIRLLLNGLINCKVTSNYIDLAYFVANTTLVYQPS
jgi:hypothetical protein